MANPSVKFKNLDPLIQAFVTSGAEASKMASQALTEEAQEAFALSQTFVPVQTGVLRGSGAILGPYQRGNKVEVIIRYGGPAAPYAAIVHEVPPNTGGRWGTGYKHDYPTRYKYLEAPVRFYAQNMKERLTVRLFDMIEKRFR